MKALSKGAQFKLLAVLAPARLPGRLRDVPTATEQGVALVWPTVRGVYMAAGTPDAAVAAWTAAFEQAHSAPGYAALCQEHGLAPHRLTGAALEAFVQKRRGLPSTRPRKLGLRLWKAPAP